MNVKTLCLGVLSEQPASGYEIKKEIEEGIFSHFIEASYGSIYPALTQLLGEGKLTVHSEEQAGKPDKKVYAITEAGRQSLAASLFVIPATDKFKSEFLFEMFMQEYLPRDHLLIAIDKQLSDLRNDLQRIAVCREEQGTHAGSIFVGDYGFAVLTAGVTCLEQKRQELVASMASKAAE